MKILRNKILFFIVLVVMIFSLSTTALAAGVSTPSEVFSGDKIYLKWNVNYEDHSSRYSGERHSSSVFSSSDNKNWTYEGGVSGTGAKSFSKELSRTGKWYFKVQIGSTVWWPNGGRTTLKQTLTSNKVICTKMSGRDINFRPHIDNQWKAGEVDAYLWNVDVQGPASDYISFFYTLCPETGNPDSYKWKYDSYFIGKGEMSSYYLYPDAGIYSFAVIIARKDTNGYKFLGRAQTAANGVSMEPDLTLTMPFGS